MDVDDTTVTYKVVTGSGREYVWVGNLPGLNARGFDAASVLLSCEGGAHVRWEHVEALILIQIGGEPQPSRRATRRCASRYARPEKDTVRCEFAAGHTGGHQLGPVAWPNLGMTTCADRNGAALCTLEAGHDGEHEQWTPDDITRTASWPRR